MAETPNKEPKVTMVRSEGVKDKKEFVPKALEEKREKEGKELKKEVKPTVIPLKKNDTVAICGFSPTTKGLIPVQNPKIDIWGCNELGMSIARLDLLFEVHNRAFPEFVNSFRNQAYIEWMKNAKMPIMMVQHYKDIPMSIPYPINEMVKIFGGFFNNTISYMLALAIHLKYKEIHLYGVDMSHPTEWDQRASVCMFLGLIQGMFKLQGWPNLILQPESLILTCPMLYGFQSDSAIKVALEQTRNYYQAQVAQYTAQLNQIGALYNQTIGGVGAMDGFIKQHFTDKNIH